MSPPLCMTLLWVPHPWPIASADELLTRHRSVEKLMFLVEQAHWFYEVRGTSTYPDYAYILL